MSWLKINSEYTNSELSQNHTEKQIMSSKATINFYLMINVMYSLPVVIEKLVFFNKQLYRFTISLTLIILYQKPKPAN